jgi:hypothetical protein
MKSSMFFCAALVLGACASPSEDGAKGLPSGATGVNAPPPKTPEANGTLGEWQAQAALPTPRGNHCAVVAKDWLVVIGGNYKPKGAADFVTLDEVHTAHIEADGTLGPWQLAGKTPSPVSSCTAAAENEFIHLVDGIYDETVAERRPHVTRIGDDGKIEAWTDGNALPAGVSVPYSEAEVVAGSLRVFQALLPDHGDAISMVHQRDGQFVETKWLDGFRGHPQYVFAGDYIYALGGYANASKANAVLAESAGAEVDAFGTPGESFSVAALPKPTAFGKAIAVDRWIFVVGGKDEIMNGKGRADVFAGNIGEGGAIAEWSAVSSLPEGRTSHVLVTHGSFLYVVGGGYDAGGLDSVFSAQVRF